MYHVRRFTLGPAVAAIVVGAATALHAQVLEQTFTGAVDDNYANDNNWVGASGSFVPDVDLALEIATIGSNTPDPIGGSTFPVASATLRGAAPDVGRLILGFGADTTGTFNLTDNASLNVKSDTAGDSSVAGDVVVGGGSDGSLLAMSGNATLMADSLSVTPGDSATFAGSATMMSRGQVLLLGETTITGPNVTLTAGSNLELGGSYTAEITNATAHSVITAASGSATLAGTDLVVDLSGIASPSVGDSWRLVEAQNIGGLFDSVSLIGTTQLGPGLGIGQRQLASGGGTAVEIAVEAILSLEVDRASGDVSIRNLADAAPSNSVAIDGYTIASGAGLLNAGWNSLDDQAVGDWRESNPSAVRLSELKPSGSTAIDGQQSLTLADGFSGAYAAFGQAADLAFSYTLADGSVRTGPVVYTGPANTLVLQIDPSDGRGRLVNQSTFPVDIDGYTVVSEDDALLTGWSSLDDQGAGGGDWREANPTAGRLSEIKASGALTISGGAAFDLGVLYDTVVGDGDVAFSFLIGGAEAPTLGDVQFATLGAGLLGDFNDDGLVNAADYTTWRDNLGAGSDAAINNNGDGLAGVTVGDYQIWRANFGTSAASANANSAVPEPGSLIAIGFVAIPLMVRSRWASRTDS